MTTAKDLFPHMSTREVLARYNEACTWDYRKDQFADALSARGFQWGDYDATDDYSTEGLIADAVAVQS